MSGGHERSVGSRSGALLATCAVVATAILSGLVAWRLWQGRAQRPSGDRPASAARPVAAPSDSERAWTPGAGAPASLAVLSAPAEAGPLPFGRDEKATYRLTWKLGESSGLPAGRAIFGASIDATARHFVVDIETAAWVATLFEARDRVETWTGADLLPSRQEQHLREGRRVTDRSTRFNRSSQTLEVGGRPPLPLPRGARDSLSALFYVRTLPLAAGYETRFPVVENGKVFMVNLRVDGVERIEFGGNNVPAFRITSRLVSASDRVETARAVAWLSTDARRVPLALEIETAVGRFRAELDEYERR